MLRKPKWMLLSITTVILFSFSGPTTLADMKDLKSEQEQLEKKKDSLDSQINEKKDEISKNKSEIDKLMEKIQDLGIQIADTNSTIDEVNAEITQTTKEIEELKVSITELEKKIAERDKLLRERIRAVQVNGGSVNYLDVLLDANSFIDFIDRFSVVNTLMEADRKILEEQAADKKALKEQKQMVEDKLVQQEADKKKLVDLKANLDAQRVQHNELVDQLEAEQENLKNEQASLEKEYHETVELSKDVKAKIVSEQKRLVEFAKATNEKSSTTSNNQSNSSSAPAISSGYWTKPSTGRFTSPYGNRFHPIDKVWKMHKGADLANVVGTPIYAAGTGVVSHAGRLGGFGNAIIITHSVDGQIFTTVYAHLSSVGVSQGQSVEKGQKIGGMGSTGNSTGSHLHFQLHDGYYSSSNTVNPLRYVPF